ncbi:cell division protein SepF [Shouchella clausii]|uniref:cell division protein SepF n=1 Tax=Shouchella tritolerans TaxID=2979466 RepID=UPI001B1AD9D7|nr:cell division protein SepF [Shouchella tritolerans]GIN11309.1 cell division protein SepF [Shouchella clausii]
MGFKTKFKRYFNLDDHVEEVERYVEEPEQRDERPALEKGMAPKAKQAAGLEQNQNVVSLQSVQKSAKMILLEPRSYDEAQEIADHLKRRKAVVINLLRIEQEQALRIVDFLSGTVYAIGGDIQKIGPGIFLCTPDNVEITGSISDWVTRQTDSTV